MVTRRSRLADSFRIDRIRAGSKPHIRRKQLAVSDKESELRTMKSLKQAPASTLKWWGLQSADAFDLVSRSLTENGFVGPTTWAEGALVPYGPRTLCDSIKAKASVSAITAHRGYAVFDGSVTVFSKTIRDLQPADSSAPPRKGLYAEMKPCLTFSLAHQKWCRQQTDKNPCWQMSVVEDGLMPTANAFVEDFRDLMLPILEALRSDDDLERLLTDMLDRGRKPEWVLSSRPGFARLPEMLETLRSRSC